MKIVVAVKVVADDQDIFVAGDRTLDYSKAGHQLLRQERYRSCSSARCC